MNRWLTSDQHFSHQNIIKYCSRPFKDIVEMNEILVQKHNELVKPEDYVFHLGDVAMSSMAVEKYLPRLNGRKFLVPGNHDLCHPAHHKSKTPEKQTEWLKKYAEYGFEGILSLVWRLPEDILLSHMPYAGTEPGGHGEKYTKYRPEKRDEWLLHGHVHTQWKQKGHMINVGCDVWDYAPVHLDQILELIKKGPV